LNFLENKNKSYLVYEIQNGFTVKKELVSIVPNVCTDEVYLIDKKVNEYLPSEKLKNVNCQ